MGLTPLNRVSGQGTSATSATGSQPSQSSIDLIASAAKSGVLSTDESAQLLKSNDPSQAARALLDAEKAKGWGKADAKRISVLEQIASGKKASPSKPPSAPVETESVAPAPQPSTQSTESHTVERGDSLWKIAQEKLGDGSRWTEIAALNKQVIGNNPNLILPGQVLILPPSTAASRTPPTTNDVAPSAGTQDVASRQNAAAASAPPAGEAANAAPATAASAATGAAASTSPAVANEQLEAAKQAAMQQVKTAAETAPLSSFEGFAQEILAWDAPDTFKQECIDVLKAAYARRTAAGEAATGEAATGDAAAAAATAGAPATAQAAEGAAAAAPESSALDTLSTTASGVGLFGLAVQGRNAMKRNAVANKAFKEALDGEKVAGSRVIRNAVKSSMKDAVKTAARTGEKVTEATLLQAAEKTLTPGQTTKAVTKAIGKVSGTPKGSQLVGVGTMAMAEALVKQSGTWLSKAAGFFSKAVPVLSAVSGAITVGQLASNSPETQAMSKAEKGFAWTSGVTGIVAGVAAGAVMVVGVATAPAWVPVVAAVAGTVSLVAGLGQVYASFNGGSVSKQGPIPSPAPAS